MNPWPHPPVHPSDRGVYVHFPYCEKKCPYCDFNSHVADHDDTAYADAILTELNVKASLFGAGPVRSLFFGGGTPSLWAPREVGRVIQAVQETFGFSKAPEITLEANPGTIHEGHFEAYALEGVNRFSIGIQSFLPKELALLGRIHDGADAERAARSAVATGCRVSLDLMYALPGQTWAHVEQSLDRALALAPEHISAYTLTIEPDTILGRQTQLGRFLPMADDRQATLIEQTSEYLEAAGFTRYEISNYARPGQEAQHNSLYWVGGPYLGLGAGANSYLPQSGLKSAVRSGNIKTPSNYLENAKRGRFPTYFEEHLAQWTVILDRLWVGLRPHWGIDLSDLAEEAGLPKILPLRIEPVLEPFVRRGWLHRHHDRWALTPDGFLFHDRIARALLDVAPPLS